MWCWCQFTVAGYQSTVTVVAVCSPIVRLGPDWTRSGVIESAQKSWSPLIHNFPQKKSTREFIHISTPKNPIRVQQNELRRNGLNSAWLRVTGLSTIKMDSVSLKWTQLRRQYKTVRVRVPVRVRVRLSELESEVNFWWSNCFWITTDSSSARLRHGLDRTRSGSDWTLNLNLKADFLTWGGGLTRHLHFAPACHTGQFAAMSAAQCCKFLAYIDTIFAPPHTMRWS